MFKSVFHKALRKKLKEKGFDVVGEFSCKGYTTYKIFKLIGGINKGHPNKDNTENAKRFAKMIYTKVNG